MQRWHGMSSVPSGWGRCVVTIGVFDGVHRGHAEIIGHAVRDAAKLGVPSVVLTFDAAPLGGRPAGLAPTGAYDNGQAG